MDNDASDVLDNDTTFRDEPRLEDLSDLATKTLAIVDSMLKGTSSRDIEFLKSVLLELMMAEKRCRSARDGESNARICTFIIQLLYDIGDFANLNYYLVLLSRKRGQLKATTSAIVNLAKRWIAEIGDMETKMSLISTLNHITLGKMFLESQRAEVAFTLAKIREDEGNIAEAANVVHSVEVETFGALPKQCKVRYLLEQMRIHLLNQDYLRFHITSKKINEKLLDGEEYGDSKMVFYEYMIQYHLHEVDYFEVAKAYYQRMQTAFRLGSPGWLLELECLLLFVMISPITEESDKFRKELVDKEEKRMKESPVFAGLFREFLSDSIISLPLSEDVSRALSVHAVFADARLPGGPQRLETLTDRVIQHNVLVASKFYTSVRLCRLAELINTTCEKLEDEISTMVYDKTIHAKIDRPAGVIKFGERKDPDTLLNAWSKDIATLMGLVDQCSRLVQKEKMIHEARLKQIELDKTFQQ